MHDGMFEVSGKICHLSPTLVPTTYHYDNLIWTLTLRHSGLRIPGTRQDELVGCLSVFAPSERARHPAVV